MANIFSVTLSGDQETPTPVASDATGTGTVVWDEVARTAAYTITVSGLDIGAALGTTPQTEDPADDVTSMHVHNAARGASGPVVFGQIGPAQDADDLVVTPNADGSWTARGIWEETDPANVPIGAFADALTAAGVGAEVALYFNVHSTAFPAGEIRGQWVAAGGREDGTRDADTIAAPAGEALLAFGRGGDDGITGGDLADSLAGGAGNDTVAGGGGDDTLEGGTGDDTINTGAGDDLVFGGAGRDSIGGMAGSDTVQAGGGDDHVFWNDPEGDLVFGGGGNDTLLGGDRAADTTEGGAGADLIRAFATDPEAATAANELSGGGGNDLLLGGNAADTIEGGEGNDTMTGNDGADVFVFSAADATGFDIIADFSPSEDVVSLEGFGAGFDPLDNLTQVQEGTVLDLGGGDQVLFAGRIAFELLTANFDIV